MQVQQQHHGYLRGHQLLASSIKLDRADQEVLDRLSDIAGSVQGSAPLPSYLTGYPLPSGRFFVFARTWNDSDATRGGCVLTHSLLIPSTSWANMRSPSSLERYHRKFPHGDRSGLQEIVAETEPGLASDAPEEDMPTELVEALFLEDRKSILWIAENPEKPILRIVDSMWPSLRSNFAFQSYSLKPRLIGERFFDLMAAPRIARGRFADWPGRRVEGDEPARHAWTRQLADEIFKSPAPDLRRVDPLGVLQSDAKGDAARLRLSLLWSDLEQNRRSSASTLGMLDILAAASLSDDRTAELLEPLIRRALREQVWTAFAAGAGRFLILLLEKLEGLPTPFSLDPLLVEALSKMMLKGSPEEVSELIHWEPVAARSKDIVGNAVSRTAEQLPPSGITPFLEQLKTERLLSVLERNPDLAAEALSGAEDPRGFSSHLSAAFPLLSKSGQDAVRTKVAPRLTKESSSLVSLLTAEVSGEELGALAMTVLKLPDRDRPAVWREMLASIKGQDARRVLRGAVEDAGLSTNEKVALIARFFDASEEELEWLLRLKARDFAIGIARESTWPNGGRIARNLKSESLPAFVGLLADADQTSLALDVLQRSPLAIVEQIELAAPLLDKMSGDAAHELVLAWLRAVFPVGGKDEAALAAQVVAIPHAADRLGSLSPKALVDFILPPNRLDKKAVRWTLDTLLKASEKLARPLAKAVDQMAKRLIGGPQLDEQGFRAWARFLDGSLDLDPRATAIAAWDSLEFALARLRQPASELANSAFSIVYPLVKSDRRPSHNIFFMPTVDRPTRLRRSLADAYLSSNWPPRNLAILAVRLGISEAIFSDLRDQWGGRRYLREMFKDLEPGRDDEEKIARKELRRFLR